MYSTWSDLQCPLRNGIIYYSSRGSGIFEHDLYSSSNHEVYLHIQSAEDLTLNSLPSHGTLHRFNRLQWQSVLRSFQSIAIEFSS
jgi:hypothetical protein